MQITQSNGFSIKSFSGSSGYNRRSTKSVLVMPKCPASLAEWRSNLLCPHIDPFRCVIIIPSCWFRRIGQSSEGTVHMSVAFDVAVGFTIRAAEPFQDAFAQPLWIDPQTYLASFGFAFPLSSGQFTAAQCYLQKAVAEYRIMLKNTNMDFDVLIQNTLDYWPHSFQTIVFPSLPIQMLLTACPRCSDNVMTDPYDGFDSVQLQATILGDQKMWRVWKSYLSIYPSIHPSIYLHLLIYLSVYLSVCLSIYLSVCLSICLSIYLSVYLSICLSVYLSVCLSIYLSVCLSVCLSVYLSICLSIYLSI